MLDVIYMYKAGLVRCYLHVQRKKLDTYMHKEKSWTCWNAIYITKKKAGLVQVM